MPNRTETIASMTPARLESIQVLAGAPDLAVFSLKPAEGGEVPAFEAGQYVTLAIDYEGDFAVRYYSIASAPEQRDAMEFYVVKLAGETVSPELFQLKPGDTLWHGEPGGNFTLARTDRANLALVCSGTGIAPFVSMLRHLKAESAAGRPRTGSVSLWHGVRRSADLAYREEMEALEREAPFPFLYLPTVSRHGEAESFDSQALSRGRMTDLLADTLGIPPPSNRGAQLAGRHDLERVRAALPSGDTAIFLCGNPGMIKDFDTAATDSPHHEHLVFEKYW